uniref:Uncharacterized protein n=1 Tax=Rhipicephalus appendiculatus TaxID=34631 RepID=A0A131Z5A8_RHIAP
MSWHSGVFFTSLALWTVAVLFVAPETQESRTAWKRGGVNAHDSLLLTWRNVTVALLCAAVMSIGYCKLRLYMDEMSDALAAGRTGLDVYSVNDGRFVFSNEKVTMTRSVLNCHDRATDFLTSYSNDIAEMEENIRTCIRLLIEDIGSWHTEVSMIARELQTVSKSALSAMPPPPNTAPSNVTDSPEQGGPGPNGSGTNTPQSHGLPKAPGDRSMLVTKNRRQSRHLSGSSSGGATERPMRPPKLAGAQADRDTEEVDVWAPTIRAQTARNNVTRENTILNVRRRMNSSRSSEYSPPEPHGFDEPRPHAENMRVELEEKTGLVASPPIKQEEARKRDKTTPAETPPRRTSEDGNQLVPWTGGAWTGGDDLDADIAPSPKVDDIDYRAASLQHLPQSNEHQQHREQGKEDTLQHLPQSNEHQQHREQGKEDTLQHLPQSNEHQQHREQGKEDTLQHLPQSNEHQQHREQGKEDTEAKPGDENTGDRL